MKRKVKNKFPRGWNESRVRKVLDYYENQTDEEAASEIEGLSTHGAAMMRVPRALVPAVRKLIAKHARGASRET